MSTLWRDLVLIGTVALLVACPSSTRQPERPAQEASVGESSSPEPPESEPAQPPRPRDRVFPAQVAAPAGEGFYTSDAAELRRELTSYLEQAAASDELEGRDLVGLVSPHAGYRYSGPTAATAYAQVRGRGYKTVVVMALAHRQRGDKVALLDHAAYETPLGPVPIDREVVRRLVAADGDLFEVNERVFRGEHSLEIQLPLLQLALGEGFHLVPIILATGEEAHARRLAQVLHEQLGRRRDVLFVASSDLSHFYPYDQASEIDRGILALISGMDLAEFRRRGPGQRNMPCGYFPILTLMELFNRYDAAARRATVLRYQNSGDTAGDRSRVVGYGAVAFSLAPGVRTESAPERPAPAAVQEATPSGEGGSIPFTREDRRVLMDLARRTVAAAVRGAELRPDRPDSEVLRRNGAAFVTLHCETNRSGRCVGPGDGLRGCIGHIIARVPLFQCVTDVGRSAAIHDRRFYPVSERELEFLSYEISVLTPPQRVTDPTEIVVGRDGLIMSRGGSNGILLPQVPVELGWDREQFLIRTCHKAGMEPTCWQDPRTTIERFTAIVWGEDLEATDHHQRSEHPEP